MIFQCVGGERYGVRYFRCRRRGCMCGDDISVCVGGECVCV